MYRATVVTSLSAGFYDAAFCLGNSFVQQASIEHLLCVCHCAERSLPLPGNPSPFLQ
jgi:hypothetical protein